MKWIAVRNENNESIEVVRLDSVSAFFLIDETTEVMALIGTTSYDVVTDPPERIKSLLAQLNGPVGEVPWK